MRNLGFGFMNRPLSIAGVAVPPAVDPEVALIAMLQSAGGESGYWYMSDLTASSTTTCPDRTTNGNTLRSGSAASIPTLIGSSARFDGNDLLVNDIVPGGSYTIIISWSKNGAPTGSVFAADGGSPAIIAGDGVASALDATTTVIDGETVTVCADRNVLFDTLNATTGEVIVMVEGFSGINENWVALGRGSGTMPMFVRRAVMLKEQDYSTGDLATAKDLAKAAVIA